MVVKGLTENKNHYIKKLLYIVTMINVTISIKKIHYLYCNTLYLDIHYGVLNALCTHTHTLKTMKLVLDKFIESLFVHRQT